LTASGVSQATLVNSTGESSIASQSLALSNPAFLLQNLPSISDDHYCMIAVVNTPLNPITIPQNFSSNALFVQWVQNNPAVAWRNITYIQNPNNQFVGVYQFGNINSTPEEFNFTLSCVSSPNFPAGTNINIQCTDLNCPINQSWTVPSPGITGTQVFGFDNSVPAGYAGALTITITPPTDSPLPSGATLNFNYYQIPDTSLELEMEVSRKVNACRTSINNETALFEVTQETLIPVGQCTLVVDQN
jgi:hypothetical protein